MYSKLLACCALVITASSAGAAAQDIFGTWSRGDGAARVRVARCGTSICAVNTWIKNPQAQSEHVGDRLIFKVQKGADAWTGTAYDPQRKLNMSATLKASGNQMTSSGCVLGGILCKSTSWTRM